MRGVLQLLLLLLFLFSSLNADEDFISDYEYGEMLYQYPRGVSCVECHGDSGEGKLIVEFRDIHGKEKIKGPDIRDVNLTQMVKALNSYHKIMPRYYLTDEEIKAIYEFLQEKKRRTK